MCAKFDEFSCAEGIKVSDHIVHRYQFLISRTGFDFWCESSEHPKMPSCKQLLLLIFVRLLQLCSPTRGAVVPQNPPVWDSLAILQGKHPMRNEDIFEIIKMAKAGVDYPALSSIPVGSFKCESVKQPGFYADIDSKCQVIRRCDTNNQQWSYLCPNMTVFNQITLTCDWFFNVDCSQSIHFYDYSNSRLYQGQDVVLLDNQNVITVSEMVEDAAAPIPRKASPMTAKPAVTGSTMATG